MATTNSISTSSAASELTRLVSVNRSPTAIASSTIGNARETAGTSGSGAPKFFTASRVPRGSISFVTPATPKTPLSVIRKRTVIRCIQASETAGISKADNKYCNAQFSPKLSLSVFRKEFLV